MQVGPNAGWSVNARPPGPPQFVKFLIPIVEKKDLNENYEEFYFSMGDFLVIFLFF